MKKPTKFYSSVFVIIALCFAQTGFAQISQGTKSIGGIVSFHFGDGDDRAAIAPDFSYFINENLAIGGRVGVSYYEFDDPELNPVVNGYIRKYKFINEKFAFFGEGFIQYSPSNYYGPYNYEDFAFGVLPGFCYFLTEKFAVDLNFGGLVISSDFDGNTDFDLSFSPAALSRFGLKYYWQ